MAILSFPADRPVYAKIGQSGVQPRIVPDQAPRQDENLDMVGRENDSVRFGNVVLPHLRDAYTLARWITGNRADAEDVVQEACLRAFRSIQNFAGGSTRAWTLTIVRHTAYTWLRKNRPTALVVVEDLEAVEIAQTISGNPCAETPESILIAETDVARLETIISALPSPFRETLVLRDVQGLDYREIAMVTGVPIGTVMSRLARGRRRLIANIGKKEP
jgi:RNA polymerase sigma factor (sigma-70 family)